MFLLIFCLPYADASFEIFFKVNGLLQVTVLPSSINYRAERDRGGHLALVLYFIHEEMELEGETDMTKVVQASCLLFFQQITPHDTEKSEVKLDWV